MTNISGSEPDVVTPCMKAWKMAQPPETDMKAHPDWSACLMQYVVDFPNAHPHWNAYTVSVIHLRPIEGSEYPIHLNFPEATHEFMIMALDPNHDVIINEDKQLVGGTLHLLRSLNFVHQVTTTDEGAIGALEYLMSMLGKCVSSPDSDYKSTNRQIIDGYLQMYNANLEAASADPK